MAIDAGITSIVKSELRAGKDPETVVEKLRDLGYSDSEVEKVMQSAIPGKVFVIKRPSRPTVFKTVVSPKSVGLALILVLVVGGLVLGAFTLLSQQSVSDAAKKAAEKTPEAQLFTHAIELHNRIVGCMPDAFATIPADRKPEFRADFENLARCTLKPSTRIEKLADKLFNVTFRVEETECGFHFIYYNDLLSVVVDMKSITATPEWLAPVPFNQTVVDSLYEQRSCDALAPVAKGLASQLLKKQVP